MMDGLCQCGCGEKAPVAPYNMKREGLKKGEPRRFIKSHYARTKRLEPVETDRGYKTKCHIWPGYTSARGYGHVQRSGRKGVAQHVHRWYYQEAYGPVPDGLELDHLCSQRDCVNPEHLEPVTRAENARRAKTTKLRSIEEAREIRELARQGWVKTDIGRTYGLSPAGVHSVVEHHCWKEEAA